MLPRINLPRYTTELPISKQKIKYRPYTTGEEKILVLASSSQDEQDYRDAVTQIVENCTGIPDITDLHPTDFEWVFLKLRAISTSNIVDVVFNVDDCTDLKCPIYISGSFDINDITVKQSDYKCPFIERNNTFLVPITDDLGMQLKKVMVVGDNDYDTVYNMLISIYDGDKIYTKNNIEFDEFAEFLDSIPIPVAEKLHDFFSNSVPVIECKVNGQCTKCGRIFDYEVNGIKDFFV